MFGLRYLWIEPTQRIFIQMLMVLIIVGIIITVLVILLLQKFVFGDAMTDRQVLSYSLIAFVVSIAVTAAGCKLLADRLEKKHRARFQRRSR